MRNTAAVAVAAAASPLGAAEKMEMDNNNIIRRRLHPISRKKISPPADNNIGLDDQGNNCNIISYLDSSTCNTCLNGTGSNGNHEKSSRIMLVNKTCCNQFNNDSNNSRSSSSNQKRRRNRMLPLLPKGGGGEGGESGGPVAYFCFLMRSMEGLVKQHPIPFMFTLTLLFFMGIEYTLRMVPPTSPPWDVGFILTSSLHSLLAANPLLNTLLAALNTVFVGMQTTYILWTLLVEGRGRSTIAALFMFTCRGILGYSTQLPLPQGFLGSGVDFPVGNVSFFLFFSGHVGGSVIASIDMRRMERQRMAWTFDILNMLQGVRLLATRGHYTIDLAVGIGAGYLCDILAGNYLSSSSSSSSSC